MCFLKKWYFEWLDTKAPVIFREEILEEANKIVRLSKEKTNINQIVEGWVEIKLTDSLYRSDFVTALSNNPHIIDALVESINRKQLK